MAVPIYISNNSVGELFLLHMLASTSICCLSDDSYSHRRDVISHVALICTSLTISNVEHFLNSIQKLAICMTSLENVYSGRLPMFLTRLFFDIELYKFFENFGY